MRFPTEPQVGGGQHAVGEMIDAGMSLTEVEETIDGLPADEEQKSALWITAWSRLTAPDHSPSAEQARIRLGADA